MSEHKHPAQVVADLIIEDRKRESSVSGAGGAASRPTERWVDGLTVADFVYLLGRVPQDETLRDDAVNRARLRLKHLVNRDAVAASRPLQEAPSVQAFEDELNLLLWHEHRVNMNRDGAVAKALVANRDGSRQGLVAMVRALVQERGAPELRGALNEAAWLIYHEPAEGYRPPKDWAERRAAFLGKYLHETENLDVWVGGAASRPDVAPPETP